MDDVKANTWIWSKIDQQALYIWHMIIILALFSHNINILNHQANRIWFTINFFTYVS